MERMPKIIKEKKIWFDIPGDELGGRVEIRHIKDGEVKDIITKITETETVYNDGRAVLKARQTESPAVALAMNAITAWENHQDENGTELKCTPDNIRMFLGEDGYLSFINEKRNELALLVDADRKEAEKN